jgi:hypothetical protein
MGPTGKRHHDRGPSTPDALGPTLRERRARPRPNREESVLTLLPPAIVPMTQEQHRRAVAALAELLMWAMEEGREEQQAA